MNDPTCSNDDDDDDRSCVVLVHTMPQTLKNRVNRIDAHSQQCAFDLLPSDAQFDAHQVQTHL